MFKRLLHSPLISVAIIVLIGLMVFALAKLWPRKLAVENSVNNLSGEISTLEKKNSELARLLDYFKSSAYQEREAKIKLNVRRPDESVVFIYQDPKTINQPDQSIKPADWDLANLSNFQKWLRYLFGK